ncbi:MAG TPA: alkaline phosphatase D family protein [Polyangiaceae bacterium]|nr:alkaline phosphatase D family protein [Polyangiaceae bacterium]
MSQKKLFRRDFLRATVVTAFASGLPTAACGADDEKPTPAPEKESTDPADVLRVFPQGLASGDPRPDSVILWTRVAPEGADGGAGVADVSVKYEVASDEDFKTLVAEGELTATLATDHTLRIKVTKLEPYTTYYYRFHALGVQGDTGRTKTAPKDDADVPVRFAFATCQDFAGRYYHAWKTLTEQDAVDFVVYLGDYVYETAGNPAFQTPTDTRKIVLPDGLDLGGGGLAAESLADYRALYKQYRSDENLKKAHSLYPFICIWDDHEYCDDCWKDHTNHFDGTQGDEQHTQQREDADQAWFEYMPADVVYDEGASYPDDIKIYRNLRYGKHMELFLTDQRYYRDDHLIPEGPVDLSVAKLIENSSVGSRIFLLKPGFDPKEAAAKPSMLGATQKSWFVDSVKGSNATWKIWGSETQLAQMVVNLKGFPKVPAPFNDLFYLTVDQWDGYRSERAEILTALSGVENLVVVTGDIHAFYASELHVDFDAPATKPVAVEYVVAGITSQAIAPAAEGVIGGNATFKALGLLELIPQWDTLLPQSSPHYRYSNSFENGIAICDLSAESVEVTFFIVSDVTNPTPGEVKQSRWKTLAGTNTVVPG